MTPKEDLVNISKLTWDPRLCRIILLTQKYTLFQNLQMRTKEGPFIGCVNDLLASLKSDNGKYYRHRKANI